jgi:glucose-1-phosphate cytidylyltransferase
MTQTKSLKTVILCGGLGTRLREETEYRPKPMVDVGGKPIVWHIMKVCAHFNLSDFVLCLGYKGQMFKEYFLSYEALNNDFTIDLGRKSRIEFHGHHDEQNYSVTLADTGAETMTGGRIKRIRKYVGDDPFVVTYGDGLADVNLSALIEFHRSHGKIATVTAVAPPSRYGVLKIEGDNRVSRFMEKPQQESRVSAGFFVFNPAIFDYLGGDDTVLEHAPLERLAREGELMAFRHDGFFYSMDTYREYLALNEMWNSGSAPWKVW